jgi:hypothetical protein
MLAFLPCGSSLLVLCIEEFEEVGGVGYAGKNEVFCAETLGWIGDSSCSCGSRGESGMSSMSSISAPVGEAGAVGSGSPPAWHCSLSFSSRPVSLSIVEIGIFVWSILLLADFGRLRKESRTCPK